MTKKSFILACDGGGIRGLATAAVLATIESKLQEVNPGKPLYEYFDLIAGTSTGSIIACGLSSGKAAREIVQLYLDRGIDIFPKASITLREQFKRLRPGFTQPIYGDVYTDNKGRRLGVNTVLQDVFSLDVPPNSTNEKEYFKFGNLLKPTLVTSYDTYNQHFIVFKSFAKECHDLDVWEVVRASSAAPVAFAAYQLSNSTFIDYWKVKGFNTIMSSDNHECIPVIDGGLSANNPAMCALIERLSWSHDPVSIGDIVVLSIGTGSDPNELGQDKKSHRQLSPKDATGWGLLEWLSPRRDIPLLRATSDGSSDAVEYQAKTLLGTDNYYRFQPVYTKSYESYNANRSNLEGMLGDTSRHLETKEAANLQKLVNALQSHAN